MRRIALHTSYALAILIAGTLAAGPVLADKPAWAGNGNKHSQNDKRDEGGDHDRDRQGKNGRRPFLR